MGCSGSLSAYLWLLKLARKGTLGEATAGGGGGCRGDKSQNKYPIVTGLSVKLTSTELIFI